MEWYITIIAVAGYFVGLMLVLGVINFNSSNKENDDGNS